MIIQPGLLGDFENLGRKELDYSAVREAFSSIQRSDEVVEAPLEELLDHPKDRLHSHVTGVADDVGVLLGVFGLGEAEATAFAVADDLGLVVEASFARESVRGLCFHFWLVWRAQPVHCLESLCGLKSQI